MKEQRRTPAEVAAADSPVEGPRIEFDDADNQSALLIDFGARLIIALAIYVLSIGPMYWIWYQARFLNGSWFIAALYEPLYQLAGLVPPLGRWLNWYICLWIY